MRLQEWRASFCGILNELNVHCAFWFQNGLCWAAPAGTLNRETAEQPGKQQNSQGNSRTNCQETAEQPGKQQINQGNSRTNNQGNRTARETAEQRNCRTARETAEQLGGGVGVRVSLCHSGPVLIARHILEEEKEVARWTSASVWSVSCNPAQLNRTLSQLGFIHSLPLHQSATI